MQALRIAAAFCAGAVCVAALAIQPAASAEPPQPAVTLGESNTLRLPSMQTKGSTSVLLTMTNVPEGGQRTTKPTLTDHALGEPGNVTFAVSGPLQRESTVVWLVTATVEGLPPGVSQSRVATIAVGARQYARAYTLTNRPAAQPAWSAAGPGAPWIVKWEGGAEPLSVTVTTQEQPVSGLRIVQSSLRDATGLSQIGHERLRLEPIANAAGGTTAPAAAPLAVPPLTTTTFYVRIKDSGARPHGKYSGNLYLAVDGSSQQQTVAVTLHASSIKMRAFGVAAIAIGLGISWLLLNWLAPRAARWQALRPVIRARDAIAATRTRLERAAERSPQKFRGTLERLGEMASKLETKALDGQDLLPKESASGFAATDAAAKLQALLDAIGNELSGLDYLLRKGVLPALADRSSGDYDVDLVDFALAALEALGADSDKDLAQIKTAIPGILNSYRNPGVAMDAPFAADPQTLEETEYLIRRASTLAWGAWGVIAVLGGFMALIAPNPGFAWLDVLYCLLWGLGLPATGAGLQALTPGGVATSIGLRLPKAA